MKYFYVLLTLLIFTYSSNAQNVQNDNLRIYLDCQTRCDQQFIKREIPFVDYVNDRYQSNVYILITSQGTGSGGREYKLEFSGRDNFEGIDDTLSYVRPATATDDENRILMAQTLKMGLVKYLARTKKGSDLQIIFTGDIQGDAESDSAPEKDPWNLWVFNLRANGNLDGDKNYSSSSFSGGASASRVSKEMKTNTNFSYDVNTNRYGEGEDAFKYSNESYFANNTTVWSITNHWSAGGFAGAQRSDYSNYDYYFSLSPAVEYNLFPYSESNNHYVGFMYQVGPRYFDYTEETIYDQMEELRFQQNISLDLSFNQKWGELSGSASFGHYFHDFSKNNLSFSTNADVRVYKGLSINFRGYYSFQRDQLNIAKGETTSEDLLTRRRQLDSNFSYYTSFGLRYRFGSLFNNVVNPRFRG